LVGRYILTYYFNIRFSKSTIMDQECDNSNSTPQKLLVTGLINLSFVFMGMQDAIFGPTLLDMQDIYETKIKVISLVIVVRAVGSVIGAFLSGLLLDKCPKLRYFILFGCTCLLGLCTAILPHMVYIWAFFLVSIVCSFACGALDTGGNVLCLDTWKDASGPYLHSIHFSFALGAFLAPVIAIPFLGNTNVEENTSNATGVLNATTDITENHQIDTTTRITILYPLVGLSIVVMSMGYLVLAIKNYKQIPAVGSQVKSDKNDSDADHQTLNRNQWFLLVIMIGFFFFYVGSEVSFGIYLTAFCVKSRLSLTKQIGAEITATFWGCFAAMRFLSIFAAIYLKPIYVMSLSCLVSCIGGILLAIYGDQSVTILWAGSAMLGLGIASIYATGLLWLKSHMKITNRIGAAMTIASSIGADVFPVVSGQLMEDYPMILMYLTTITIISCSILFMLAIFIGGKITHENKSTIIQRELSTF